MAVACDRDIGFGGEGMRPGQPDVKQTKMKGGGGTDNQVCTVYVERIGKVIFSGSSLGGFQRKSLPPTLEASV
jgi:hypothetical protein